MKDLKTLLGESLYARIKKENETASEAGFDPDIYLFQQWAYRVPKGWYGFSLGKETPFSWALAIHLVLGQIELVSPSFEIHQIKLKYGGLRFYFLMKQGETEQAKEICALVDELEELCDAPRLVY